MSESHSHPHVSAPAVRQASVESKMMFLEQRLSMKAQEIHNLENADIEKTALLNDLMGENSAMQAAINQITVENRLLRKRLGLDELGVLEITDEEANGFEEAPAEVGSEE